MAIILNSVAVVVVVVVAAHQLGLISQECSVKSNKNRTPVKVGSYNTNRRPKRFGGAPSRDDTSELQDHRRILIPLVRSFGRLIDTIDRGSRIASLQPGGGHRYVGYVHSPDRCRPYVHTYLFVPPRVHVKGPVHSFIAISSDNRTTFHFLTLMQQCMHTYANYYTQ